MTERPLGSTKRSRKLLLSIDLSASEGGMIAGLAFGRERSLHAEDPTGVVAAVAGLAVAVVALLAAAGLDDSVAAGRCKALAAGQTRAVAAVVLAVVAQLVGRDDRV